MPTPIEAAIIMHLSGFLSLSIAIAARAGIAFADSSRNAVHAVLSHSLSVLTARYPRLTIVSATAVHTSVITASLTRLISLAGYSSYSSMSTGILTVSEPSAITVGYPIYCIT